MRREALQQARVGSQLRLPVDAQHLVDAGHEESSPTWGRSTMFTSESSRLLPGRSGMSSVRSSSTATKPGSPPRGEASTRPAASTDASTTSGERAMKRRQWASRASSCLRSVRRASRAPKRAGSECLGAAACDVRGLRRRHGQGWPARNLDAPRSAAADCAAGGLGTLR